MKITSGMMNAEDRIRHFLPAITLFLHAHDKLCPAGVETQEIDADDLIDLAIAKRERRPNRTQAVIALS